MAQERTATAEPSTGLLRQLGVTTAAALVVSNMIGTGIFVAPIFLAGPLGDPKIIFAVWFAGALCALAGAFC
jgi:APA family basic amino acid/polyamine antiporter